MHECVKDYYIFLENLDFYYHVIYLFILKVDLHWRTPIAKRVPQSRHSVTTGFGVRRPLKEALCLLQ